MILMRLHDIFGNAEEDIFLQSREIYSIATKANSILERIISGSGALEEVRKLEKEAADEAFRISNLVTSGAVAPNLIYGMTRMLSIETDIVDAIFNLSRQLLRYRIREKHAAHYTRQQLKKMSALAERALKLLYRMHALDRIGSIRRVRSEIKVLEREGDYVKDSMLDFAYKSGTSFKTFYHIAEVAHLADDVLDGCEDSADIILSIMLSIVS